MGCRTLLVNTFGVLILTASVCTAQQNPCSVDSSATRIDRVLIELNTRMQGRQDGNVLLVHLKTDAEGLFKPELVKSGDKWSYDIWNSPRMGGPVGLNDLLAIVIPERFGWTYE